ncbi:hypothetical protein INT48_009401 [Thamnidium elegans]|uniref:SANT domain-containing protein n=1 Tax=Thamnidium elegans TaxID=101142 RepID=A0A8H7SPG3_9FUNG|nr:hypothetical protein INT48_009401 [Thamnidium elegans]
MSSLTSIGINKNKKGFAPKINTKRNVRKAPTASSSTKEKIPQQVKQEQTVDSSTIQQKIDERISTLNRTIDESHSLPSTMDENIDIDSSETNECAPILERPDCALEIDGRAVLKFEQITPGPPSIARKRMSIPLKEDEGERMDAKTILAAAPVSSVPASPMAPSNTTSAATSPIQRDASYSPGPKIGISAPSSSATTTAKPKKKVNKSKSTAGTSIGIGVPTTSSGSTAITVGVPGPSTENNEEDDDEMGTGRPGSKKRKGPKIHDFRLPENLRTLNDIKEDPADIEALDKPMASFTKDIDGIVSKNFKEMELLRYESLQKLERAAKMSPEELAAVKKKEAEEAEEDAKKKKIAKQKEDERRRKEADGHVLAESSNALQVRLVDGQIVLDTDSLTIERTQTDIDYGDGDLEVVEENSLTKKINSNTYSKRTQSSRWSAAETEDFYDAISQFGTDFEMISMVMPGRTRSQIRSKFSREEKLNPNKVTDYLIRKKKPLDLLKYEKIAGIELEAVPDDFDSMQLA